MSENSKISWTHHTFNPWWGCAKVSPACDNCYAERDAGRYMPDKVLWGVDAERRTFGDKHWNDPVRWNRKAEKLGIRYRVFCASMADVFDKNAPEGARDRLWELIKATPNLDWLLLTKRIGNAEKMLPADWGDGYTNAWLGITAVNQEEVDRDVPKLLLVPARIHWISAEPLLEKIDIRLWLSRELWDSENQRGMPHLDWVITGGESGPKARPAHPHWYRSLRNQCEAAGIPFHFKQWGEWIPGRKWISEDFDGGAYVEVEGHGKTAITRAHEFDTHWAAIRVGKKAAGRLLDGRTWDEYPA